MIGIDSIIHFFTMVEENLEFDGMGNALGIDFVIRSFTMVEENFTIRFSE